MFHIITNVQRGDPISLQQYIDNRDGNLSIGLKSITYTVGWYNIEQGTLSWRINGGNVSTRSIPPGLYGFAQLKEALKGDTHTLEVNKENGIITLTVAEGHEILLSDGMLKFLGLDDGLGGTWLDAGVYTGDHAINFTPLQMLWVYLEELNTSKNYINGAPTTILTNIGLQLHTYGDINTSQINFPEYKRLRVDTVSELTISIRDSEGKIIDNHGLPIHVALIVK